MIMLKLFFISILLFSQAHSFCIYNKLTDGSSFYVTQVMGSGAGLGRVFTQYMEQGDRRCCNYKEKDCSRNQQDDLMAIFSIKFDFANGKGPYVDLYGRCTTGGGFAIHGDSDDYFYECIDASNYPNIHRLTFKKEDLYTVLGTA